MLTMIDAGENAGSHGLCSKTTARETELSTQISSVELLAPLQEPRQMRNAVSFATHILQAPRGRHRLAAREANDDAELKRIEAKPLGALPEIYCR